MLKPWFLNNSCAFLRQISRTILWQEILGTLISYVWQKIRQSYERKWTAIFIRLVFKGLQSYTGFLFQMKIFILRFEAFEGHRVKVKVPWSSQGHGEGPTVYNLEKVSPKWNGNSKHERCTAFIGRTRTTHIQAKTVDKLWNVDTCPPFIGCEVTNE